MGIQESLRLDYIFKLLACNYDNLEVSWQVHF